MGTADSKKGPVVLGSACRVPGEGICSSARDSKIIDWGTCRAGPYAPPEADAGQTGQFLGAWWPLMSLFLPVVLSFCDDWPRPTWLGGGGTSSPVTFLSPLLPQTSLSLLKTLLREERRRWVRDC